MLRSLTNETLQSHDPLHYHSVGSSLAMTSSYMQKQPLLLAARMYIVGVKATVV